MLALLYTVLHCTAQYFTAQYCALGLYSTVLYFAILHCSVLYCTALFLSPGTSKGRDPPCGEGECAVGSPGHTRALPCSGSVL